MNPNTWYPGKPQPAQNFRRLSAFELNVAYQLNIMDDFPEIALPVDGDQTALFRGKL